MKYNDGKPHIDFYDRKDEYESIVDLFQKEILYLKMYYLTYGIMVFKHKLVARDMKIILRIYQL